MTTLLSCFYNCNLKTWLLFCGCLGSALHEIFLHSIFQNLPSVYYYLCPFFASKCHLFHLRIVPWGASIMYEGGVFEICYSQVLSICHLSFKYEQNHQYFSF